MTDDHLPVPNRSHDSDGACVCECGHAPECPECAFGNHKAARDTDGAGDLGWDEVWVLVMDQRDAPQGCSWFMKWTGIGPAGTWDEAEAATFPSEQAAMQSPAFSFPMTFYKPKKVT